MKERIVGGVKWVGIVAVVLSGLWFVAMTVLVEVSARNSFVNEVGEP